MDKDYFNREYAQIMREFRTAKDEDEQWKCRERAARLERTAAELFGFKFCDELHDKYI